MKIPKGWQLVPVEPTTEMVAAAFVGKVEDQSLTGQIRRRKAMADDYAAMLAAAPTPPAIGEVVVTTDEFGKAVAVTRQDEDGRILSVVWEAPTPLAQEPEISLTDDYTAQITSIRYLSGELKLQMLNDVEVPREIEAGDLISLMNVVKLEPAQGELAPEEIGQNGYPTVDPGMLPPARDDESVAWGRPDASKLRKELGELLAIIHRDGGHYRATHGDLKAVKDAVAVVIEDRYQIASGDSELLKTAEELCKWDGLSQVWPLIENLSAALKFSKIHSNEISVVTKERDDLLEVLRDIAEKVKRCDYTEARNDALIILSRYQEE